MKTLLVAVNSQYIHSNLAVWQLKADCENVCDNVIVKEFNINQQMKWVYSDIISENADAIAFSCYIWNIEYVLKLACDIKQAQPSVTIILGGPEVSFDYKDILINNKFIDYIVVGEGDISLPKLLENRKSKIDGVCSQDNIKHTQYQFITDLNSLPNPYTHEMLQETKGKIIYFEGSRGCPYSCSYCLSQIGHGVRNLDIQEIKNRLLFLESNGVELLKFVDRTFNCNTQRAIDIWNFAIDNLSTLKLHFEVGADLINENQLEVLTRMPQNKIQIEAGVQSTNELTLSTVCRKTSLRKLQENSKKIIALNNIHYHLDLIAGLPFEDYNCFKNSFNDVYSLKPHQLQLGFLKMLKGSKIRNEYEKYNFKFRSYPPYEVISNDFISANEILKLTKVEEVVERYYNSGRFELSLEYLISFFETPFDFYEKLSVFVENQQAIANSIGADRQFNMLFDFACEITCVNENLLKNKLLTDFILSGFKGKIPEKLILNSSVDLKKFINTFCENDGFTNNGFDAPENKKDMAKRYRFVELTNNPFTNENTKCILLVDYFNKNHMTGRFLGETL